MSDEWIDDDIIACVMDYADDVERAARVCGVDEETARKILDEYAEPYDWEDDEEEEYWG